MRMWTTKSAVSRLESGRYARPTLATVEKYALAVGARVEIRVRSDFGSGSFFRQNAERTNRSSGLPFPGSGVSRVASVKSKRARLASC